MENIVNDISQYKDVWVFAETKERAHFASCH